MFSRLNKPCRAFICATPECWWRSLALSSKTRGPIFCNQVWRTLICHSRTTCANACRCSFNTQHFRVITAWFPAVRFRPVLPALGVIMNSEGFGKSWNLSFISLRSSLPISAYRWNMATWSANHLVSHQFEWWTWAERLQNGTAFRGGGAPGSAFSFLSCRGWSASLISSSLSGSEYSAGFLTSIGRNVSLGHRKIGESTQVSSGHASYHCLETSLRSSVSTNTDEKHASRLY